VAGRIYTNQYSISLLNELHGRVGTGPAGPDRLEGLNRPVFAGFYRFKIFFIVHTIFSNKLYRE